MTTKKDYVYGELKKLILNEEFKEGELLISENEICKRYNVSREPVRRALKKLIEKGYVNSKQGKGYYINPREIYLNTTIASLSVESKAKHSTIVLEFKTILNHIGEQFNSKYLHTYKRIIKTEDNVIYEEGYVPYDLFENFNIKKCEGSILSYFQHEMKYTLTHDRKELKSMLIEDEHIINQYTPKKVTHSIQTTHNLYSNNVLIQISKQIKYNSDVTIIST
ncbi:GntR family transcriptional regulator [Clostridium botulinum]|uniref:GntR family transcriptional regulator n=1 Tax=Clostridium botulinum TaxID=1491 RepID=UPI001E524BE8|nr:GntR family transcriptional regulator [Clostridium botulinum]MCC5426371.1 GntR family transcriptional regulator [Clostridium botulinum]